MSWSRVVWKELFREEEMTIPTIWIVDKNVCWPKGINVIRACSQQWPPKDDWMKYPIIKIKIQSGILQFFLLQSFCSTFF